MSHEEREGGAGLAAPWAEGYARLQLARARANARSGSSGVSLHAAAKAAGWLRVVRNMMAGEVAYGSRTPFKETPPWATLEVMTGGFATGQLLAAGPLQPHENDILRQIGGTGEGRERQTLNDYFLSEPGFEALRHMLHTGLYKVSVPEEGALLTVAWLVKAGRAGEALTLVEHLLPFFDRLRFYPAPAASPMRSDTSVFVHGASVVQASLQNARPHPGISAQKEAVEVWAPFFDSMVALMLETVRGEWPCQVYGSQWAERARSLLSTFEELRGQHRLCAQPDNPRKHFAQLRQFVAQCAQDPRALTGKEVGRIRLILQSHLQARGAPGTDRLASHRAAQMRHVSAPLHSTVAHIVAARVGDGGDGLHEDDIARCCGPVGAHLIGTVFTEIGEL